MCTNGMSDEQFEQMIDMVDDYMALGCRWIHKLAHGAGDAGCTSASEKLHAAQLLLADVRSPASSVLKGYAHRLFLKTMRRGQGDLTDVIE